MYEYNKRHPAPERIEYRNNPNEYRRGYEAGWESAVIGCERSNILKGPITLTSGTVFTNRNITLVTITAPAVLINESSNVIMEGNHFLTERGIRFE